MSRYMGVISQVKTIYADDYTNKELCILLADYKQKLNVDVKIITSEKRCVDFIRYLGLDVRKECTKEEMESAILLRAK